MDKTNKEEALTSFFSLSNAFFNSHLLLVQQNIALLLKSVAYYDTLLNLLKECNEGTHFELELRQNMTERGIILPSSRKRLIAFVIGLLFKMDKEQSATDIILRYFPSADKNESYKKFLNEIILPLQDAVEQYFTLPADADTEPAAEDFAAPYSERIGEKLTVLLKQLREETAGAKIAESERSELFFAVDSFLYLLEYRDTALIRFGYFALKKFLSDKRIGEARMAEIKNFLAEYNVL